MQFDCISDIIIMMLDHGVVVWNAILKSKINPDTSEFVFAKALKACILDGNLTL